MSVRYKVLTAIVIVAAAIGVPLLAQHHQHVVELSPLKVAVPAYAAQHDPKAKNIDLGAIESRLRRIEDMVTEVLAIAKASQAEQPAANTTPAAQGDQGPVALLNAGLTKCATCHDETTKGKGGDYAMFDKGTTRNYTADEWRRISAKVKNNKMPPESSAVKLTADERNAIVTWAEAGLTALQSKVK